MSEVGQSALQAVIFDLDGLMVDTEPLARQAWDEVLQEFDLRLDEATFIAMIGLRLEDSSHIVHDRFQPGIGPAELVRREREAMTRLITAGVRPMPGLFELLALIDRYGLPWAVATSSRRAYATAILDSLGLLSACRTIASGDDVAQGKPAPDVYLLAAERLIISPSYCLALEDSVPGATAAVAAGMISVAVPGAYTSPQEFGFVHYVYPSLLDVAARFDQLIFLGNQP